MAEFQGKNYAKSVAVPSQKIPPGEVNGGIMTAYDEIDLTAAAINDTIKLMKIPKGARLLRAAIKNSASLGGASALQIGWEAGAAALEAADLDGILAASAMTSAAVRTLDVAGTHKEFAEEVQVLATITGTVASAGKLSVELSFVLL